MSHRGTNWSDNFVKWWMFCLFFRAGTDLNLIQFWDIFPPPPLQPQPGTAGPQCEKTREETKRTWQQLVAIGLNIFRNIHEYSCLFVFEFDVANFLLLWKHKLRLYLSSVWDTSQMFHRYPHHRIKILIRNNHLWLTMTQGDKRFIDRSKLNHPAACWISVQTPYLSISTSKKQQAKRKSINQTFLFR